MPVKKEKLNIWIVKISEPLPIDSKKPKLMRAALLANILASRDHHVTWWTSNFNHFEKKKRFELGHQKFKSIELNKNYTIRLIDSPGYKKNFSISRFVDHKIIAKNFKNVIKNFPQPDIIISSLPTVELAYVSMKYASKYKIPIVTDLRDLWPNSIWENFFFPLNWLAKQFLFFNRIHFKKIINFTTSLITISPDFLKIAYKNSGRTPHEFDRYFWLAQPEPTKLSSKQENYFFKKWKKMGILESPNEIIVSFFGAFSKKLEMEPIFYAAKKFQEEKIPIKFVLAGVGDLEAKYKKKSKYLKNIFFIGWVNQFEIYSLMGLSQFALAPYKSRFDFTYSVPSKIIEYLSGKLPVLISLDGHSKKLIEESHSGLFYDLNEKDSLYLTLKQIIIDKEKINQMSQNAFKLFKEQFDEKNVYNKMADHIEKIMH